MLRLFVGIELPAPVRQQLVALQGDYADARWHAPEQLHLTLNFIGSFDRHKLAELDEALVKVAAPTLLLEPQGVGYFGTLQRPLVIWAGVRPSSALQQLQADLAARLDVLGIMPDVRPYTPHITLARVRQSEPLPGFLERNATWALPAFSVEHICLFLSSRGELGMQYQVIKRYSLLNRA